MELSEAVSLVTDSSDSRGKIGLSLIGKLATKVGKLARQDCLDYLLEAGSQAYESGCPGFPIFLFFTVEFARRTRMLGVQGSLIEGAILARVLYFLPERRNR